MKEPDVSYSKRVTGNYYFKPTLLGLILYVEVEHCWTTKKDDSKEFKKEFVKANLEDSFELGLTTCNKILTT